MLNKVQIIGRLAADPEIRAVGDGSVANLRIAVNERWKDKRSGELRESTEWVSAVAWGAMAERVQKCGLRKGDAIYFEGSMKTRKWTDKDGVDRYKTEVVAQGFGGSILALSPRHDSGAQAPSQPLDDEIPFYGRAT